MGKRLVVALVCDTIHPYSHGGREQRYHELAQRLADRFELHVYTMHWWNGPPVYTEGRVTFHAISPLLPLYANNRRSIKQAALFALACLRLLRCQFDVLDADHMPYFQVFVLRAVAALKRKPLVVTWHEVWSRKYWLSYLGWPGLVGWLVEWLAMRMPTEIIAASQDTAERLRISLRKRSSIATVPNGIDLNGIRSTYPDTAVRDLVVVGRLMAHKRVDMLLDAVALLHARGIAVTCRIIGDGPERITLHKQAQRLGIDQAVEFRHDVGEQKEVYALLKAARIFVSPSAREGFGIAVLEALACGVAVVTTSAPDNLAQHLVARSSRGVICEPSAGGIAASVQRLLAEPDRRPSGGNEGDLWLSDYDWDVMADRVREIYVKGRKPERSGGKTIWNLQLLCPASTRPRRWVYACGRHLPAWPSMALTGKLWSPTTAAPTAARG
jgi:glycosyltransferase involved in cell wall biosynthesis